MAMVSNDFLGAFCVDLGLHKHLRFTGAQLHSHIQRFVEDVQMTKEQATKDGVTPPNWWVNVKEATPKALSDVVESLVGAMFVDSEFDYNVAVTFFNKYMLPFFEDMHIYDSYANQHPTTFLSNRMRELRCERFTIKNAELPYDRTDPDAKPVILAAVIVHGNILAYGEGEQSKYARIAAAKQALEKLDNMTPDVFMRDWCFCDKIREEVEKIREEKAKGTEVAMAKHLREVYGSM
jgi:endoribonuclease Dicer